MGVIARVLEEQGLVTTSVSMVREHTEKVKQPRALFVPYPFGHPFGEADDAAGQTRVLRAMLDLVNAPRGPVLVDFRDERIERQDPNLAQASSVAVAVTTQDVAFEVTVLRPYYEQWVKAHEGRTAVGVSGVNQRRFRGVVRALEALAEGRQEDLPERKPDVPLPNFLRYATDDLKAFYFEARMQQRPQATSQEVNQWFWGETALAELLRRVRDCLTASGDPGLAGVAFGIAR